jgi:hypothetical protein
VGRPRIQVSIGTILELRQRENLGWRAMAQAYMERTGQYIGVTTIRRKYLEARRGNHGDNGRKVSD